MKLVVPEPHYDQFLWDFPTELLQKLKKQLNDKMIQNVYYTYHSWVFFAMFVFHFTVIRNNQLQ